MDKLSARPNTRDMISSRIESRNTGQILPLSGRPIFSHHMICEYPDCQREYDGTTWIITKDYRAIQPQ